MMHHESSPRSALSVAHFLIETAATRFQPLTLQSLGTCLTLVQFRWIQMFDTPCFWESLLEQEQSYLPNAVVLCYGNQTGPLTESLPESRLCFSGMGTGGIQTTQWFELPATAHFTKEEERLILHCLGVTVGLSIPEQQVLIQQLRKEHQVELAPYNPRQQFPNLGCA